MFPVIVNPFVSVRALFLRIIIYPSCDVKSWLFANDLSVNMKSFIVLRFRGIYLIPCVALFICYDSRLFRFL